LTLATPDAGIKLAMHLNLTPLEILLILFLLIIAIAFCWTLQTALARVSPENRLMAPGLVWLILVPCFGYLWQFFVAIQVPGSLKNEFRARGRDDGSDYGRIFAVIGAVLIIVSAVVPMEALWIVTSISLALFVIFWVKVANYSSQLARPTDGSPPSSGGSSLAQLPTAEQLDPDAGDLKP
jgi:hypothetical protein